MAMDRNAKAALKDKFAARFEKANAIVIAEFRGLTVADLTHLRVALKKADAEYRVLKNRVAKIAILEKSEKSKAIADNLKGPIGVVFMYGDVAQATKALLGFEKDKSELFKVTAGVLESKKVGLADLKTIADLPTKDVLLARIIGALVSPHRNLLGVLNAVPRDLVNVVNAIKDKKQASAS